MSEVTSSPRVVGGKRREVEEVEEVGEVEEVREVGEVEEVHRSNKISETEQLTTKRYGALRAQTSTKTATVQETEPHLGYL